MEFDKFTIILLISRPDAPKLDEKAEKEIQDAHLAYLAKLHEDGYLLAAGPVLGKPERDLHGLCIMNVEPERACELEEQDPAVRAGWFIIQVFPWMVPRGAMSFAPARFPHSSAETQV